MKLNEVLTKLNKILSENKDEKIFVTIGDHPITSVELTTNNEPFFDKVDYEKCVFTTAKESIANNQSGLSLADLISILEKIKNICKNDIDLTYVCIDVNTIDFLRLKSFYSFKKDSFLSFNYVNFL